MIWLVDWLKPANVSIESLLNKSVYNSNLSSIAFFQQVSPYPIIQCLSTSFNKHLKTDKELGQQSVTVR